MMPTIFSHLPNGHALGLGPGLVGKLPLSLLTPLYPP